MQAAEWAPSQSSHDKESPEMARVWWDGGVRIVSVVLGILFWLGGNSVVPKKKKKISLESSISTGQLVKGELFGYGWDCLFGKRCFFVLILFCPFVNMWMFWVKHPKIWDFMFLSQTKTDQTRLNQDFFFLYSGQKELDSPKHRGSWPQNCSISSMQII